MEEKNINEKESLELISQMIQSTKEYIEVGKGNHFLYWGYYTTALAVIVYLVYEITGWKNSGYLWLLMFVFWIFMTIFNRRKHHAVMTYTNKVVNHVWYVIGSMFIVTFAVILVLGLIYNHYTSLNLMMPLSAIYVGIGVSITGIIVQNRWVANLPFVGIGIGLYMLTALYLNIPPTISWNLLFGLSFIIMMAIPGHILNKKEKTEC
jgi:hypothetical protein